MWPEADCSSLPSLVLFGISCLYEALSFRFNAFLQTELLASLSFPAFLSIFFPRQMGFSVPDKL